MIKSIFGGFLIAIGAFFLFGFSVAVSRSGLSIGDVVGALLIGIGPVVGGGLLIRSHVKTKRKMLIAQEKDEYARQEKEILRLAQEKGGRLSIPDIVVKTSMSTEQAEQVMREMTTKGYVDMQVTDSGVIVYEFYEIAHRKPLGE
jgi:hypothetical protein